MKKKREKKKEEETKVNEPTAIYAGKRIRFFSSLEEENEYNYKMMARRTPTENLQNAVKMIKALYKDKLSSKNIANKRIKFD